MDFSNLIDIHSVGFASIWIIGLAIILATFGYIHYYSLAESRRTVEILKRPIYQLMINAGLMIFCIGISGASDHWWESILWLSLAIGFGVYLVLILRGIRKSK